MSERMTDEEFDAEFGRREKNSPHSGAMFAAREAGRARASEAAKDAVIKAPADALDVTRPPERPTGCWCHHARDVRQAGHSAACVAACDAISKAAIRSGL